MCKHFLSVALQGLAYVEFVKEADASQAVLKMDGMELEGNNISVAISNPPRRNVTDKPGSSRPSADMMPRQVFGSYVHQLTFLFSARCQSLTSD